MKFDKIMEIAFRILCGALAVLVIVGFCVSCVEKPIKACAISPSDPTQWAGMVEQWRDEYETNLASTLRKINEGLASGDIDAATDAGKEYLAVQALQVAALNNPAMSNTLHAVDLALSTVPDFSEINNLPSSMAISGGCASGVYTSAIDGQLHSSIVYRSDLSEPKNVGSSFSYHLCSSDEFDVYYSFSLGDSSQDMYVRNTSNENGEYRGDYQVYSPYSGSDTVMSFTDLKGYFTSTGTWTVRFYNSGYYLSEYAYTLSNNNSVTVQRDWLEPYSTGVSWCVGSCGVSVNLPSDTVPTEEPWKYYDETILPYIRENYPNITNEYLVFPYGYTPAPAPDPTEPATFPNGGIYIDKQFNIGVNIIFPTDASGQPVTDEQGETVTEIVYITDTSPLDGEYNFKMPTLPHLNIYDATLPNPDISSYSDGIGFIWTACYNILTDSDFMPVVVSCYALALFGFILWKLGG